MTAPKKVTTEVSARRKMELSHLTNKAVQQEAMGTDLNLEDFGMQFEGIVKVPHIQERIVDASIVRTIDGASTLTLVINDYDRALLKSDQLANRLDVQIDGLWFRLTGCDKSGDQLTLTFEDREIGVLRTYSKWKYASRSKVTRAEFVLNLIREVREFDIPVVIPELHELQPLQRYEDDNIGYDVIVNKVKGMPKNPKGTKITHVPIPSFGGNAPGVTIKVPHTPLTVKGSPATQEQIQNGQTIVAVGQNMGVGRKLEVCAIMVAIVESTLQNLPYGDKDSIGLFQQRASWGSYEERHDPKTSSRMFYNAIKQTYAANPDASYTDLCWMTQRPAPQYNYVYGKYFTEANEWVSAMGIPGGDAEVPAATVNGQAASLPPGSNFYFWRGNIVDRSGQYIRKPENSWTCIQRLAQEVDWKAFFVSGVFYYISEDALLKQQPLLTLDETAEGIIDVSGDFHNNKKAGTLTITALAGRWSVPPGCVVVVDDMGVYNGRWLVSEYDRNFFDLSATITLSRKLPKLPEPAPKDGNYNEIKTWVKVPATPGAVKTPAGTTASPNPRFDLKRTILAKQLVSLYGHRWTDISSGNGLAQMQATEAGNPVVGPLGAVYLDEKVIAAILWLIQDQGYTIETSSWCVGHPNDGMSGHSGGHAVDISSINGIAINSNSQQTYNLTYAVAKDLHDLTGQLAPRQLITGGYGGHRDMSLTALCITDPRGLNPDTYYTPGVMAQHCNHIHLGY